MRIRVEVLSGAAITQIAALQKQLQALVASMTGAGGMGPAAVKAQSGLHRFMTGISGSMQRLESWGKNLQWTGRQIEYRFTLPLLLAGVAAGRFAMKNEEAFTRLRKVYGDLSTTQQQADKDMKRLRVDFLNLSNIFGVHQDEVIGIGATWAQAGAQGLALSRSVKSTLETMILGEMDAVDAAKSLISIQAQWGHSSRQLRDDIAVLNMVENQTAADFPGLIAAFVRTGSMARTAGMDVRHLAASVAALVPQAGSAEQAGNALKTMLTRLFAPTKGAADALGFMGINIKDAAWQSLNGSQKLELFAQKMQGLTQAQKIYVATQVGTRFQANKLITLTDQITNKQSAYNRALDATSSKQRNAAQYTKELGIVLASQPQAFKRSMTILQNAMAQIIMPLMPAILAVANAFTHLAQAFADLNPNTQKFILGGLALLAVLGPLMSYMGVFAALIGRVTRGVLWMFISVEGAASPLQKFGQMLGKVGKAAKWMASGLFDAGWAAMKFLGTSLVAGATKVWNVARPVFMWLGRALGTVMSWAFSVASSAAQWVWGKILAVIAFMTPLFAAVGAALGAAMAMAFEAAAAAAAAVGWQGALIAAVVAVLAVIGYVFRKQLGKIFGGIGDFFYKVWSAFPRAVSWALTSAMKIISTAVKQIWKSLSYLNPFQRHSPSLVDNVIAGVDIIAKKYASLTGIGAVYRKAAADLEAFSDATRSAKNSADDKETAGKRSKVVGLSPNAGPAFDTLVGSLSSLRPALQAVKKEMDSQQHVVDALQVSYDALSNQLDAAKEHLNALVNTPITGMRAMSDQIFANEMAQKQLRLEIMRLEDAGQSVEDLSDRMARLNGEIETMRGNMRDLQLAGAGSDVLGPMKERIEQLEAQRRIIGQSASPIQKLTNELDALQRAGERLDLEQSLKFDPLTRQIDQVTNAMDEMPFDQLLAQITAQQSEVTRLQTSHDVLQSRYDTEKAKLDVLSSTYSAMSDLISNIESAINDLASAYDTAAAAASDAQAAFDAAGAGDFALDKMLPDEAATEKMWEEWSKKLQEQAEKAFGEFDPMKMIREKIGEIGKSIGEWLSENIGQPIANAFNSVVSSVGGFFSDLGSSIANGWNSITGSISGGISRAVTAVREFPGQVMSGLASLPGKLLRFARELPGKIVTGIREGAPKLLYAGGFIMGLLLRGLANGLMALIWLGITIPFKIVEGITKGLPRVAQASIGIATAILGAILGLGGVMFEAGARIIASIAEGIITGIPKALEAIQRLPGQIIRLVAGAPEWLFHTGIAIMEGLWRGLVAGATTVWGWLRELPGRILSTLGNLGSLLLGAGRAVMGGFWDGLKGVWGDAQGWFNRMPEPFQRAAMVIGGAFAAIPGVLRGAINGVIGILERGLNAIRPAVNGFLGVVDRVTPGELPRMNEVSIPRLAAGGLVRAGGGGILANIGEGAYDEAVVPLSPTILRMLSGGEGMALMARYNQQQVAWLAQIAGTIELAARSQADIAKSTAAMSTHAEKSQPVEQTIVHKTETHFHGDLSFPNVKNGDDAEAFLRRLESIAQ